jgi:hypothetical protein
MFRNTVQPAILPSEVAFVEGRELLRNKKKKRGARDTADEEYFEKILKQDLKEMNRDGDNDDDDDDYRFDDSSNLGSSVYEEKGLNDQDTASKNDSSGIDSNGESSGTGTTIMQGADDGLDRMLRGKDGMEFIGDIRCCLILGLIAAAATLTIGVYAISKNDQDEDFYREVRGYKDECALAE